MPKIINYERFARDNVEIFTEILNNELNIKVLNQFDENPIFKKSVVNSINKIRNHDPKTLQDIINLLKQDRQLFTNLQRAAAAYQIEKHTSHIYKILTESKSEYVNVLSAILNDILPGGRIQLIEQLQGDKKALQAFLAQYPSARNLLHTMVNTLLKMHPQVEATRISDKKLGFFSHKAPSTAANTSTINIPSLTPKTPS